MRTPAVSPGAGSAAERLTAPPAIEEAGGSVSEGAAEEEAPTTLLASRVTPQERLRGVDRALRPTSLTTFLGQPRVVASLQLAVTAALKQGRELDHVLLAGPPGLGKTSLSLLLAGAMGTQCHVTSAPLLEKAGDLVQLLLKAEDGDIVFLDEIHRLPIQLEEFLYPALEDRVIDVRMGDRGNPEAKVVRLPVKRFTLVGATTRPALLSAPLRDRFGLVEYLELYPADTLAQILLTSAQRLGTQVTPEAARQLAEAARGTPRIANRLLRRVEDWRVVHDVPVVDRHVVAATLEQLAITPDGCDRLDARVLHTMATRFPTRAVGLETLSLSVQESADTIESHVEPHLVWRGLIERTPRGRQITAAGLAWCEAHPLPVSVGDRGT